MGVISSTRVFNPWRPAPDKTIEMRYSCSTSTSKKAGRAGGSVFQAVCETGFEILCIAIDHLTCSKGRYTVNHKSINYDTI